MTDVIAWDLDSTLANTLHRQPFIKKIKAGEATWQDYAMLAADDEPIRGAVALLRMLSGACFPQVVITGRNDCARTLTWDWFDRHQVPVHRLYMRPDGDRTPNGEYKVQTLHRLARYGYNVRLFVEDWDVVADKIRIETGIPVLVLKAPYPPDAPHASGGAV